MPAVIIYMTLQGCTEKAALKLKKMSWKEVDLINLKRDTSPLLDKYDTVIIGGSVHMGEIQGKIKKFCNQNERELLEKRLGLYLCHMHEGEKAVVQFNNAYSEKLRNHAVAKGLFGGELNLQKMNHCEKLVLQKVAGVNRDIIKTNTEAIESFGKAIFHLDKS